MRIIVSTYVYYCSNIIAATSLSLSTRGPMLGRPPDSIGRSEEGLEKGGKEERRGARGGDINNNNNKQ